MLTTLIILSLSCSLLIQLALGALHQHPAPIKHTVLYNLLPLPNPVVNTGCLVVK